MIRTYFYDLWNGKETVGQLRTTTPIRGRSITVSEVSIFKLPYGTNPKTITCPIDVITTSDDGVTIIMKRVINVRRKSKRQIALLKGWRGL